MKRFKLAIVVSHPIQHFCPQYSNWSRIDNLELKVFFASRHGIDAYHDINFEKVVQWQGLKLNFNHEFLPGAAGKTVSAEIDSHDIQKALADYNPDILLVYGYVQPLQRKAMAWARNHDKKLFMIGDSESRHARSWPKDVIKKIWLPRLFSRVDIFLTVGDANEAYYRNYSVRDQKFVRVFFPIDTELFDQAWQKRAQERSRVRTQLGIPDDHMVVLMVGKLVPWKRQIDLIQASNLLQTRNPGVTIILAGTGPEETHLKELVLKHGAGGVLFAEFVAPEELVHYYSAADVYAHCSAKDPHSLAISEAIYMGLPVLVSDTCGSYGPSDDVQSGLNGYVYPSGDVGSLTNLLLKLAVSPPLRQMLGAESRILGLSHQALAHGKAITQAINAIGYF